MINSKKVDYTYFDSKGILHLSGADASVSLIELMDIDSQKNAIYKTFSIIDKAKSEIDESIANLENAAKKSSGEQNPLIVDKLVDTYHLSVFYDAANSMSTIGMISPTFESIIYEIFLNIGKNFGEEILKKDTQRNINEKKFIWDCHYVIKDSKKYKDIVKGIKQLLYVTKLDSYFPNDFIDVIDAMFTYRNKMFHNGFEWPIAEREKFKKKIISKNWPDDWFFCSTSNDEPWIFYMSTKFQKRCISLLDEIINGVGQYYLENHEDT